VSRLIINRVIEEANYIIKTKSTIRELAKIFKVSKSTVHKDLHERLKYINKLLYNEVSEILNIHISERHIRGGNATRVKYLKGK